MTTIFAGWEPRHTEMFGRFTLKLAHRLHESDLFTDEALARLIEGYPASHYNLHSMGSPDDPRFLWRRGLLGDCAGEDALQASGPAAFGSIFAACTRCRSLMRSCLMVSLPRWRPTCPVSTPSSTISES